MNDQETEFLTVSELSSRLKFSRQTIYNMIFAKRFIKGEHYIKPSRKKILFMWPSVRSWLLEEKDEKYQGHVHNRPPAPKALPMSQIKI
jgi:hypothetical protein